MALNFSSLTGGEITRDDLLDQGVLNEPQPVEDSPYNTSILQPVADSPGGGGQDLRPIVDQNKPVNELFKDANGNLDLTGLDEKEKELLTQDIKPDQAGFKVPGVKTFIVLILVGLIVYLINEDYI